MDWLEVHRPQSCSTPLPLITDQHEQAPVQMARHRRTRLCIQDRTVIAICLTPVLVPSSRPTRVAHLYLCLLDHQPSSLHIAEPDNTVFSC